MSQAIYPVMTGYEDINWETGEITSEPLQTCSQPDGSGSACEVDCQIIGVPQCSTVPSTAELVRRSRFVDSLEEERMSTVRIEPVLSGQISAMVSIPVQYRMQGAVPFDVRINGMTSLFDLLPEQPRIEIIRQIIEAEARNRNEAA